MPQFVADRAGAFAFQVQIPELLDALPEDLGIVLADQARGGLGNSRFVEARDVLANVSDLRQGLDPATAPLLALTAMFGYLIASPETPDRRRDLRTMFSLYLRDPTTAA